MTFGLPQAEFSLFPKACRPGFCSNREQFSVRHDKRCSWFWPLRTLEGWSFAFDGSCLWSDCALHGWIGLESEAASLAGGGGEFQDLVTAWT